VLSIPDMMILGVLALLVFGEKKLPGVMRQAGRVMRDVQNTSQSFLREMDRAADIEQPVPPPPPLPEEAPVESSGPKEEA
jgi:TatA/E family protein of Tat protein translocase